MKTIKKFAYIPTKIDNKIIWLRNYFVTTEWLIDPGIQYLNGDNEVMYIVGGGAYCKTIKKLNL
jgi:hypothetical protein